MWAPLSQEITLPKGRAELGGRCLPAKEAISGSRSSSLYRSRTLGSLDPRQIWSAKRRQGANEKAVLEISYLCLESPDLTQLSG